jgi:hypothetical protein
MTCCKHVAAWSGNTLLTQPDWPEHVDIDITRRQRELVVTTRESLTNQ